MVSMLDFSLSTSAVYTGVKMGTCEQNAGGKLGNKLASPLLVKQHNYTVICVPFVK